MADRIPGSLADTCVRLFGRGEAFDSEGFITFFSDTPMYQFGNGEPCLNKAAIKASIDGFFSSVDALYHDIRNVWEVGDVVFVEMDVTYWRKDGTSINLPCADILRFEGDKIKELRIFMDANPIFNRDMQVGEKASVMTISEGRQVTPPGMMRRYFYEHKEGIARVAAGLVPKWSIAGPKWPIVPRSNLVTTFQGALRSGNQQAAKEMLTDHALLRIANRQEVTGSGAILAALGDLFGRELLPTGATARQTWEPDANSVVIELDVEAIRMSDQKQLKYACVETYRFEGDRIAEWRIYPAEPALLAPESLVAKTS